MPVASIAGAPAVRVLALDTDATPRDEAHGIGAAVAAPRAAELHAREAPHEVAPAVTPERALHPSSEPRPAADAERSRAAAPPSDPPLRNPWDVTTFGGRS
jgi:hypothetical protein